MSLYPIINSFCFCTIILSWSVGLRGQQLCIQNVTNQASVISNYHISVELFPKDKKAYGTQSLSWKNTSPDTIREIPFYMYLNAFKNLQSSYLKGSGGEIFGRTLTNNSKKEWGWIEISKIKTNKGVDLTDELRYIQLNDGNIHDQSVIQLKLKEELLPGDSISLQMEFEAKLPYIISRAGYSKNDYFFFNHWYPQPGVYEKDKNGDWGWNCHQFFRGTEFYADFGDYLVDITIDRRFVVGASGCMLDRIDLPNNKVRYSYQANNVIDFAWIAYPLFEEYTDFYKDIQIKMLIPEEHCMMAPRYLEAVKHAFEYLEEHVGPYPYPSITICDPPMHALRSGLMEYPMLITCGSFYNFPEGIRTIESLVIHEFTHMYFMATIATNEKEEAWMDEGFVTFYEDKIMDHYYGKKSSLIDFYGLKSGNSENTRLEYTTMNNPSEGTIARPGWEIKGDYKGLIYAKTATMLRSLEGYMGKESFEQMIKSYYIAWKFKHPKEADFRSHLQQHIRDHVVDYDINYDRFLDECLHGVGQVDYRIDYVRYLDLEDKKGVYGDDEDKAYQYLATNQKELHIGITNLGTLNLPVELLCTYVEGRDTLLFLDQWQQEYHIQLPAGNIEKIELDPQLKLPLDVNLNNNSFTIDHPTVSENIELFNKTSKLTSTFVDLLSWLF